MKKNVWQDLDGYSSFTANLSIFLMGENAANMRNSQDISS